MIWYGLFIACVFKKFQYNIKKIDRSLSYLKDWIATNDASRKGNVAMAE